MAAWVPVAAAGTIAVHPGAHAAVVRPALGQAGPISISNGWTQSFFTPSSQQMCFKAYKSGSGGTYNIEFREDLSGPFFDRIWTSPTYSGRAQACTPWYYRSQAWVYGSVTQRGVAGLVVDFWFYWN
ncbi:hypothetical protein SMC26_16615 [Actinomadura fulvescens]|uniref:Uncharacterized protein n=1 Tax=Actinomadura fulvescens TaxID=46160 RepID=A0ABP6BWR8_9ACTN